MKQLVTNLLLLTCLLLAIVSATEASQMSDGESAYRSGNYTTALTDFQQAASAANGTEKAKAYYEEGLTYHKLNQYSQAVAAYGQAQAADPSLSFASSPDKFQHNLQIAQADASRSGSVTGSVGSPSTITTSAPSSGDPAATALANGNVYVAPELQNQVSSTQLEQAAQDNDQMLVKIAVLDHVPPDYNAVAPYAKKLHDYLNLGKNGLVVVAAHGRGAGVADISSSLSDSQESKIAQKHAAQIGSGDYNTGVTSLAEDLATQATTTAARPMYMTLLFCLVVIIIIVALLISASLRKKVQLTSFRGPLEQNRSSALAGIEYLDQYIDVLPKNNSDTDQVRAFRQAAAYKVDQASKIMTKSTEITDLNRAQSLFDQAGGDIENAKKYMQRASGGAVAPEVDQSVKPVPFPTTQAQVSQVAEQERGVSFFSSQPAPVASLVPVTLNVDGQQRNVMATPQEAEQIRRGQMPPVRSFNVGGQQVPWYAYQNYDPYNDYWTYQNNGWRGVAGGAVAGFIGAELLNSLFSPRPYWGGGWNSPYAYGPGWDSWGGWGGYGGFGGGGFGGLGGGYDQGYVQGEEQAHSQDLYQNDYGQMQDPNAAGGASFMGSGGGYDTSDYGGAGGASFMGGDRS